MVLQKIIAQDWMNDDGIEDFKIALSTLVNARFKRTSEFQSLIGCKWEGKKTFSCIFKI